VGEERRNCRCSNHSNEMWQDTNGSVPWEHSDYDCLGETDIRDVDSVYYVQKTRTTKVKRKQTRTKCPKRALLTKRDHAYTDQALMTT